MRTLLILACLALAVQGFPGHGKRSKALSEFLAKKPFIHGRIVGGTETAKGGIPYIVSLRYGDFHFCGGSIYDERWIVTAAHCVGPEDEDFTEVYANEWSLSQDEGDEQIAVVETVYKNGAYDPSSFDSDIALLYLQSPLTLGGNVQSIALDTEDYPANGVPLQVSGWGTTSSGGSSPDKLRTVSVPTVDYESCDDSYDGGITNTMICAGVAGKDSCQGDSGGPLVNNATRKLVGVVSWGRGCAFDGYPGVYSRVTALKSWIDETVGAFSHYNGAGRIVGGSDAARGDFPQIVSLQSGTFHFCGGSIFDKDTILTAAHCVDSDGEFPTNLFIEAGKIYYADDPEDDRFRQRIQVRQIILNGAYTGSTLAGNDIALLKLESSLEFNYYVAPIVLPAENAEPVGKITVVGWGAVREGGGPPTILQYVDMWFYTDEECEYQYEQTILPSMVCAGGGGNDSCQGDSGGPLFDATGVQIGIVSWGRGCARPGWPGVNTQVSYFRDWLVNPTA